MFKIFKRGKTGKHTKQNELEETQESVIRNLQLVINSLEDENKSLKNKVKEKEHNELILLENASELRTKVTDLENNLEFITNQLPKTKLKLIKGE